MIYFKNLNMKGLNLFYDSNKKYITKSNNHTTLPVYSREEFHRYASNLLSEADFCTEYPSGWQIKQCASALGWTLKNEKKRHWKTIYNNPFGY